MSLPNFGVRNPVPVNLLMTVLLVAGVYCAINMTREFFPEIEPEAATVTLPYPGATPEEIEETLARKVEDALADLDEVDELVTTLAEGGGGIVVRFREGVGDVKEAVDEVERAVDGLLDLPDDAERLQVTELQTTLPTIMVSIFGEADEQTIKRLVRETRDDLRTLPGMGEIVISGVRAYEVRVDIDRDALIAHGISLPHVASQIRAWMRDVPGGTVRTSVGNINVRTVGVEERAEAILDIVVKATTDGQILRVRDIGQAREYFVDEQIITRFTEGNISGPSATLTVNRVGDQDAVGIAEMVRAYVAARRGEPFDPDIADLPHEFNPESPKTPRRTAYDLGAAADPLPANVSLAVHSDLAKFIEGRLNLLSRNAFWGMVLVFGTLLLFLNWRVALWVGVGLTTALCGTLLVMTFYGITLNLLTMFGLIVVLGLLVDDAIVVAENIQARHDRNESALVAAVRGAEQVFWPVVATVLTSIVAFLPLTFIEGSIGDLLGALPMVVACALFMSLLESILILPSHMGHSLRHRDKTDRGRVASLVWRLEQKRDHFIADRVVPGFGRLLNTALHFRYVALSAALAAFLISMGMVAGGRAEFEFLPSSDAETLIAELKMPVGTPIGETEAIVRRIEQATRAQPEVKNISTLIGIRTNVDDTNGVTAAAFGTHLGQLFIELTAVEDRTELGQRDSGAVKAAIRDAAHPLDGVDRLTFAEIQGGPGGPGITIMISGNDDGRRREAVNEMKRILGEYAGVVDIADDSAVGQREVKIALKPGAAALGFTVADVAQQVRGALYGIDAHVFSDRQEDIDVRVRLDEVTRRSLLTMENLWLINPRGHAVPITEIATLTEGAAYSTITRNDRRRTTSVTADTVPEVSPESIVAVLPLDAFRAQYPDLEVELGGRQEQMADAFSSLPLGFGAALLLIYVILAWLFKSYTQPIAVMLGIPFALIGVIWGHWLLGYKLTFLSIIGFVALSGIVVNDSLILVEFYNTRRQEGIAIIPALVDAGKARLRAIFLTTVTTVLGLTPLMLEQSFQAKFLIPMAVSIAAGLISATVLILVVLPCIMLILDDIKRVLYYLWFGLPRPVSHDVGPSAFDLETE